jgi:hypothetical protein
VDYKELRQLLHTIVNTESGKRLLAYLKDSYLLSSSVKSTVEETYYELGRKELIQELIQLLDIKEDLDNIVINR